MGKLLIHSVVLITAITVSFIWPKSKLAEYDFYIIAVLFSLYYLKKKLFSSKATGYRGESRLLESVIFTLAVLTVVNSSGGTTSPYFFLVYFLLFSLSLILEPAIAFTASLTLLILFLIDIPPNAGLNYYIGIFSFIFLTPFSLFVGHEYLESIKAKLEKSKLQQDTLLFMSLNMKSHLKKIKEANELSTAQKEVERLEKLIDKFEKEA